MYYFVEEANTSINYAIHWIIAYLCTAFLRISEMNLKFKFDGLEIIYKLFWGTQCLSYDNFAVGNIQEKWEISSEHSFIFNLDKIFIHITYLTHVKWSDYARFGTIAHTHTYYSRFRQVMIRKCVMRRIVHNINVQLFRLMISAFAMARAQTYTHLHVYIRFLWVMSVRVVLLFYYLPVQMVIIIIMRI